MAAEASSVAIMMERGRDLFAQGRYQEAARVYEDCAAALENDEKGENAEVPSAAARLYSNLSACRLKLGDPVGAEEWAHRCVRVQPSWWKAHARLGACYACASDVDDVRLAQAHAAYTEALDCAERATGAADAMKSVAVYRDEVVRILCRAISAQTTEARAERHVRENSSVLSRRRRVIRAGPSCVRMLVESAGKDQRHPSIRLAAVLQLTQLAASPSHRELFLPVTESSGACSPALGALISYAGIRKEDMDRLCCQRDAVADQGAHPSPSSSTAMASLNALHRFVVGTSYATVHPLACAAVGLKNLLLTVEGSQSSQGRGGEGGGYGSTASRFLLQKEAMEVLRTFSFRNDTAFDRKILESVGFCYKKIVESLLSYSLTSAAQDDLVVAATVKRYVTDILGAGVPGALQRLMEHAEVMDLPDHAASLGRLHNQIIKCPFHPDNQIM